MATIPVVKIELDGRMPAEKALRKFKRKVEAFGVLREYRKRQEYEKPSVRKKEKEKQAEKRRTKPPKRFDGGTKL